MNIVQIEQRIKQWNERVGNTACGVGDTFSDVCSKLKPQAKVILEEAKELLAAIEDKDEREVKDGLADVLFTSLRLISLIGDKYDLFDILNKVCDNNDLKYTTDYQEWLYGERWRVYNTTLVETSVDGVKYYCLKNNNGKVVKPKKFPKVEL